MNKNPRHCSVVIPDTHSCSQLIKKANYAIFKLYGTESSTTNCDFN